MKALIIIFLIVTIFGSAGLFTYEMFVKPRQIAKEEAELPPPPPPPDPSLPDFRTAMDAKQSGDLLAAREALRRFLDEHSHSSQLDEAKDALGEVNTDIFFSQIPAPEKKEYIVQRGDALGKIERKMKTRGELIMRANNLDDPRRLQIGQKLMINDVNFSILIDRENKKVVLYNHGQFFKQYRVKTWEEPPGKKKGVIRTKVQDNIAWRKGERVAFGSKDYIGSPRWVTLGAPGYTLYSEAPEGPTAQKPPAGLGLAPEAMEEISTLVGRGTPVTID